MEMRRLMGVCLAAGALAGCSEIKAINSSLVSGDIALRVMLETCLPGVDVSELRPGLAYGRWETAGPLVVHVVAIDLRHQELYLRPILGHDRIDGGADTKETLLGMAKRTGALVAINGDYSSSVLNVAGLTIIDGQVNFAPKPAARASLVIGRDKRVWMGRFHPEENPGPDYYEAIGGGPVLVSSTGFHWDRTPDGLLNGDNFGRADYGWEERNAWTVVGLSKDRRTMLWIMVVGPAWYSVGMTPVEMGKLLGQLQCGDAIRLEGGRASQMVVNGKQLGIPPGEEVPPMPLGSALGLFAYR